MDEFRVRLAPRPWNKGKLVGQLSREPNRRWRWMDARPRGFTSSTPLSERNGRVIVQGVGRVLLSKNAYVSPPSLRLSAGSPRGCLLNS